MKRTTKTQRAKGYLKGVVTDEVSFCGRGANQNSHISIVKVDTKEIQVDSMIEKALVDKGGDKKVSDVVLGMAKSDKPLREKVAAIMTNSETLDKTEAIIKALDQYMDAMASQIEELVTKKDKQEEVMAVEMEKQELEMLKTMAYMSDDEKGFWKGLTETEQTDLLKVEMNPRFTRIKEMMDAKAKADKEKADKDKKTPVKKTDGDDETVMVGDQTFSKADIGDGAFAIIKAQGAEIAKANKRTETAENITKAEQDKRIQKELEEEAGKLFPRLPGSLVQKAAMLKNIRALPVEQQEAQIAMLAAGDAAISKSLGERGFEGDGKFAKAEDQLDTLAKQYQKDHPEVSFEKAYAAVLDTAEGEEIYNGMDK